MLTTKQKETLKILREGGLTAKQKADFYYRLSKIFKNHAETTVSDMNALLDTLPDSYSDKINLYGLANHCMDLLTSILGRLEPTTFLGDVIVKHVRVEFNNPMPALISNDSRPSAIVTIIYKPSTEEIELIHRLDKFSDYVETLRHYAEHDTLKCYSSAEFHQKVEKLKGKQDLKITMGPVQ